jgi:hypothetical protein
LPWKTVRIEDAKTQDHTYGKTTARATRHRRSSGAGGAGGVGVSVGIVDDAGTGAATGDDDSYRKRRKMYRSEASLYMAWSPIVSYRPVA